MMRRLLRGLAAICAASATLILLSPTPGGAEAPLETGWWSRQLPFQGDVTGQAVGDPVRFVGPTAQLPPVTTTPLPVPPPTVPPPPVTTPDSGQGTPNPAVPEGGLWVANDTTGPVAISALRFQGNIGSGELTLTIADGTTTVGPIVACPALSDWSAGPAGAWRDRPAHDCDRLQLSGRLSPDNTEVSFAIPDGFAPFGSRQLEVVILPRIGTGDVYNVYFEAPDDGSLEVFSPQTAPPPETTLPPIEQSALPTTVPPTRFAPPPTSPVTTAFTLDTTDDTVAAPAVDLGGGSTPVPRPVASILEPLDESRAARIFAVLVLFGIAGGLFWISGQEVRPPRLLGGLAGNQAAVEGATAEAMHADFGRGIGRFRRERTGPPTRF